MISWRENFYIIIFYFNKDLQELLRLLNSLVYKLLNYVNRIARRADIPNHQY